MSYDYDGPPEATAELSVVKSASENLLTRYSHELKRAKENVDRLEKLLKLLNENPQVTEIIQLMGRH